MEDIESVGMFYFSGTGNTGIVATLLAEEFRKKGLHVNTTKIEDVLKNTVQAEIEKYDIVGMGYPIHALNAPKIFFKFIKKLPAENKKTFIFKCSADPFMNGGTTSMVRTRLTQKGFHIFYEKLFVMPSNVLIQYNDELVKQLYDTAVCKAEKMAEDILSGKVNLQKNDIFSQIFTGLFSGLEWMGTPFFGKDLTVSDSCDLCEECVKNCPTGNIFKKGDKIKFGWKCVVCLRCVYNCPQKAIEPRLYKFFVLKEYKIQKVINNPNIKGDYISKDTKGYYKHFYDYMTE